MKKVTCRPTVVVNWLQALKSKGYGLVCVEQSEDHRRVWRRASKVPVSCCDFHSFHKLHHFAKPTRDQVPSWRIHMSKEFIHLRKNQHHQHSKKSKVRHLANDPKKDKETKECQAIAIIIKFTPFVLIMLAPRRTDKTISHTHLLAITLNLLVPSHLALASNQAVKGDLQVLWLLSLAERRDWHSELEKEKR